MTDLPQHRLDSLERKLLILHALDALGECGNLQLISFMAESGLMHYYDLQGGLWELKEDGQVVAVRRDADEYYSLTPAGREALALFSARVARSVRDTIDQAAAPFSEKLRRQRELSAQVAHEGGSEYHVLLRIVEHGMPLLGLDISVPTAQMAAQMRERWPACAQAVYDAVIKTLLEQAP